MPSRPMPRRYWPDFRRRRLAIALNAAGVGKMHRGVFNELLLPEPEQDGGRSVPLRGSVRASTANRIEP
ncbi:hypothetical protein F8B43_0287 [Methylorubrum populi]|uniref:Uncharacterized protein n=1 Tax=Methylorubrum populi TaxID=223967 RepID=A0A833J9X9_9HYPH|nr:hypothetical protein F8B43_0287 [Methylorubrum populi]